MALHGGFIWGGNLFEQVKSVTKKADDPSLEVMVMPPPEVEPPDATPENSHPTDVSDLAPPSLTDVPSAAVDSMFTQQIQPPPPPRIGKGGAITIPNGPPSSAVGKGISNVFDVANLDQRPEPRFQPKPKYPMNLKRAGIIGSAVVQYIVDTSGEVRDAVIIRSTHREFENPALETILKSKFRPGKKGNAVVNTRMEQEISFTLKMET